MSGLLPFPSGGRHNLRLLLFVIILATAPLYCIGFVLWGVAPGAQPAATATPRASATLRLATATPTRTHTPFRSVIVTATRPLPPTPRQFRPPAQPPQTGQQPQPQPQQPVAQPPLDSALPVVPPTAQQPVAPPVAGARVTETSVPIQQFNDGGE
ncbi:MAG: hypothetical protein OXH77_13580 [Anaerolineaceae bacterium]|nr:hypothetical protein [Anaerolineaceae bacterium]